MQVVPSMSFSGLKPLSLKTDEKTSFTGLKDFKDFHPPLRAKNPIISASENFGAGLQGLGGSGWFVKVYVIVD